MQELKGSSWPTAEHRRKLHPLSLKVELTKFKVAQQRLKIRVAEMSEKMRKRSGEGKAKTRSPETTKP
jgi:hypothetical protein